MNIGCIAQNCVRTGCWVGFELSHFFAINYNNLNDNSYNYRINFVSIMAKIRFGLTCFTNNWFSFGGNKWFTKRIAKDSTTQLLNWKLILYSNREGLYLSSYPSVPPSVPTRALHILWSLFAKNNRFFRYYVCFVTIHEFL